MNGSQTQFNKSQNQMRRTNFSNPGAGDYATGVLAQTNGNFGATNSSNSATLKGKLNNIEIQMQHASDETNNHKKDVNWLQNEKNTINEMLKIKVDESYDNLFQELTNVESEMNRHFAHQNSENMKLHQQITTLKGEKTALRNQLLTLLKRIKDLEEQVGNDENKA